MLAVFTKWEKTDINGISWPDIIEFSNFNSENLPPGFTQELFDLFTDYIVSGSKNKSILILNNMTTESGNGNKINIRFFENEEHYSVYKAESENLETKRQVLFDLMKLKRTVKVSRNEPRVLEFCFNDLTYEQMNTLFNDDSLF